MLHYANPYAGVAMCINILMQKHLRYKKVQPSKVESYLEVNA